LRDVEHRQLRTSVAPTEAQTWSLQTQRILGNDKSGCMAEAAYLGQLIHLGPDSCLLTRSTAIESYRSHVLISTLSGGLWHEQRPEAGLACAIKAPILSYNLRRRRANGMCTPADANLHMVFGKKPISKNPWQCLTTGPPYGY
jgi:hypothetical protein